MKTWVKLYTESIRDPKIGTLTWAQRGIWSALLCLAGELDVRDEAGNETGALDTLENVAWHIRCDVAELSDAVAAFEERGMIEEQDGILLITNYRKRQQRAPSDRREAVAARVKRHRARSSPACNEHVTSAQRGVTPPDTEADTEADTDTEADAEETRPGDASPGADSSNNSPDVARMFQLVEKAGILPDQATAEQYLAVLEEAGNIHLLELAFEEAAKLSRRPSPKWLMSVVQRCQREKRLPGQWRPPARAAPGSNGKPADFGSMTDEERIKLALKQNAAYGGTNSGK